MKALWFSVESITNRSETIGKNGRGWIESLAQIVSENEEIDLTITYLSNQQEKSFFYDDKNKVKIVPLFVKRNWLQSRIDKALFRNPKDYVIEECMSIINHEKPDIIQVFGTEWCFGLLAERVNVPIIIHIQGFYSQIWNCTFLPGQSFLNNFARNPCGFLNILRKRRLSLQRVEMEHKILSINKHFFGRTEWDKSIVKLFNPNAHYYYCSEAIRDNFLNCVQRWKYQSSNKLKIVSVGNGSTIKGVDVILKTSLLLRTYSKIDFEWTIVGCDSKTMAYYEEITGIMSDQVNVIVVGRKNAEELLQLLMNCSMYVHTSYTENSPNSVCEAQLLGIPIICTDVGGCRSLFSHDYDSKFFIPANDPFYMASKIKELYFDKEKQVEMANQNYLISHYRHSHENLYNSLLNAYQKIINDGNFG